MMNVGWWKRGEHTPTGHYGMGCRSFFVPGRRCQAPTLACQALKLGSTLEVIGSRLKGLASSLRPPASSCLLWWWK